MGWTVTIGEGVDAVTIEESALFNINAQSVLNDKGEVDHVDVTIDIEGDVVESTAAGVATSTEALSDEVITKLTKRRVQVALDSTNYWDFTTANAAQGPHVVSFRTNSDEGSGDSHWRYGLTIFVRKFGSLENQSGVYDLTTSLAITTVNGEIVRKVWRASARATSAAAALAKILTFKPAIENISEEVERFFEEARATGVWVWEPRKNSGILNYQEEVEIVGGGKDYVESMQAGGDDPVLHVMRRRPVMVTIRGVVRGFEPSLMVPPPPHLSEDGGFVRLTGRERRYNIEIETAERGIYRLRYEEMWLITEDITPVINHGTHNTITWANPPPDGAMA